MPRGRQPKSPTAIPTPPTPEVSEVLSGLYLFGTVIDRTRRTINTRTNNSTAVIVTYTLQDTSGRRYYVDEYSPDEFYELNEYAEIPVYVKAFKKRSGDIGYSFCVQQEFPSIRGEHF